MKRSFTVFLFFQFVVGLAVCFSTVSFSLDCGDNDQEVRKLLRDIGGKEKPAPDLTDAQKKVLRDVGNEHAFLFDKTAPLAEELLKWQPPKSSKRRKKPPYELELPNEYDLTILLEMFSGLPKRSQIYLVGNGMYPAYLIFKGLFAGSKLFDRIHFLPVSRDLAVRFHEEAFLSEYFDFLGTSGMKGDHVVIDSVSDAEIPNSHSLLYVSQALRFYLNKKVGIPFSRLKGRVIPLGIPEENSNHFYAMDSVRELKEWYRDRKPDFFKSFIPEEGYLPYAKAKIDWEEVSRFYSTSSTNNHYWSGKFHSVDSRGFPVGERAMGSAKSQYNRQKQLAEHFRQLILDAMAVARESPDVAEEIQKVLKDIG